MNYHNITKDDMLNGDGLRVVLWVSGCHHKCNGCQNPQTWDYKSGIEFGECAKQEIFNELQKDYISGITFSGGDPLNYHNIVEVVKLCDEIREKYPEKTIWLYTGYKFEEICGAILNRIDVLVDGKFEEEKEDIKYPWAGSTNQKVINLKLLREKFGHKMLGYVKTLEYVQLDFPESYKEIVMNADYKSGI